MPSDRFTAPLSFNAVFGKVANAASESAVFFLGPFLESCHLTSCFFFSLIINLLVVIFRLLFAVLWFVQVLRTRVPVITQLPFHLLKLR